jgi:hypothetical protein
MPDEVLDEGDGNLAQGLVLADDDLAQFVEDLARAEGEDVTHGVGL